MGVVFAGEAMGDTTSTEHVDRTDPRVAVVVAGGDPFAGEALQALVPAGAYVVAADSGLHHAQLAGVDAHVVIGDLDSAERAAVDLAVARGARVERFPVAKDETDLELALDRALAAGVERIVVVGGHGGRADHFLANALLLGSDRYRDVTIDAWFGSARVAVVRSERTLEGRPGDLVSLLPVHGPATGVTTAGLRYPLTGETLHPGSTRGVSNELVAPVASVRLETGVLLAIAPGERSET